MSSYIKVENNPYLVRDSHSKAILNTNVEGLNGYKKERENRIKLTKMIVEHDDIKKQVEDINEKLNLILQKLT